MSSWCSRCGARRAVEFKGQWFEESERCRECGVASPVPPMLNPAEGEVPVTLADLPPAGRAAVTARLVDEQVLYRWEPDLVLMVPGSAAMKVRRILDEAPDGEVGDDADGDDVEGGDWPAEAAGDGGEAAQEAMADLFVAAVDLRRSPYDDRAAAAFVEATDAVLMSLPPYGIDPDFWRGVQRHASEVTALLSSSAPDEMIADRANDLRGALRDFV